MIEIAKQMD